MPLGIADFPEKLENSPADQKSIAHVCIIRKNSRTDTSMKCFDRVLQKWRMHHALRCLPETVRLIDIGAHEGEVFQALGKRLEQGFGIEPLLKCDMQQQRFVIKPGYFPIVRPLIGAWNAVTMLAVLEHIPAHQQTALAKACFECLEEHGLVIVTVPSPFVDSILAFLRALRLIDGMSLEEHFGFQPNDVSRIFSKPLFRMVLHKRFQFGLNNLFVFEKQGVA